MVKEKILVSSCLLGCNCKYNGKNNYVDFKGYLEDYEVHSFCPEVEGGLSIPRIPCEINGEKVLNLKLEDKTSNFKLGAKKCLEYCVKFKIKRVIFKEKSPSCGVHFIYDGTFLSNLIEGSGVTSKLLKESGIKVESEVDVLNEIRNKI